MATSNNETLAAVAVHLHLLHLGHVRRCIIENSARALDHDALLDDLGLKVSVK